MIKVESLRKSTQAARNRRGQAVDRISFEVQEGELLGFLGPTAQ